jgi:hypothetical protein
VSLGGERFVRGGLERFGDAEGVRKGEVESGEWGGEIGHWVMGLDGVGPEPRVVAVIGGVAEELAMRFQGGGGFAGCVVELGWRCVWWGEYDVGGR